MAAEINNKQLEETMRMVLKEKAKFADHRDVARSADNAGQFAVANWIRAHPHEFHLWINIYTGVYSVPEIESWWE